QGFEAPLGEEGRLVLLAGNEPHHVLIEPRWHGVGVDVGHEAVAVAAADQSLELFGCLTHGCPWSNHCTHEGTRVRDSAAFMSRSRDGRRAGGASRPASCARLTS